MAHDEELHRVFSRDNDIKYITYIQHVHDTEQKYNNTGPERKSDRVVESGIDMIYKNAAREHVALREKASTKLSKNNNKTENKKANETRHERDSIIDPTAHQRLYLGREQGALHAQLFPVKLCTNVLIPPNRCFCPPPPLLPVHPSADTPAPPTPAAANPIFVNLLALAISLSCLLNVFSNSNPSFGAVEYRESGTPTGRVDGVS